MITFRKHVRFDLSILVIAIFIGARLLFIDVVPFWDSKSVTDCVFEALIPNLRPLRLNCHHPSMGYLGILAIGQIFDLRNQSVLNLTNLILAVLALMGFSQILRFLFFSQKLSSVRNHRLNIELAIMTALLAFHPLFFAHSVNPNLDFAVTVFFILSFYALMYRRAFLAVLCMTILVFSKETGLLLYVAAIGTYTIVPVIGSLPHLTILLKKVFARFIALSRYYLPLGLFLMYYLYQTYIVQSSVFWRSSYNLLLNFALRDPKSAGRTFTRLLQTFVLNFNWLLSGIILLYLLLVIIRIYKTKKLPFSFKRLFHLNVFWWILLLCFFVYGYFIFLLNTYTLVRYLLPLIPILLLCTFFVLKRLVNDPHKRIAIWVLILVLFILQTFRTVDPVSRYVFGTVPFGRHELLRMTRLVNECCGIAGQDQLAYNTEHLTIDKLIGLFYQAVHITPETPIFVSGLDAAELFTPADIYTLARTNRATDIIVPTIFITDDIKYLNEQTRKKTAYFVYLPWNDVLENELGKLAPVYKIGPPQEVNLRGYALYYYVLTPQSGIVSI